MPSPPTPQHDLPPVPRFYLQITGWQNRPLDSFYAILYIDALVVKVRDGGAAATKAARLTAWSPASMRTRSSTCWASGWHGRSRFWAGVLAELRNRGIKDVLFVCCDR